MVMKKVFQTEYPVIINESNKDKELFPPGFRYRMGSIIYTVKADVSQETNSPMREVSLSDGRTEIVPLETLIKDVKDVVREELLQGGAAQAAALGAPYGGVGEDTVLTDSCIDSFSSQQGADFMRYIPGKNPADYVRKDSIPCYGCSLPTN